MKRTRKYFPVLAAATLAAGLAIVTAPASRAQAQSDTTASSTTQPSADTQQRLQDLEKEMLLLQKEIVSLKESETPSIKTAAYVQPAAADASATAVSQAPAATAAPAAPAAATPINLAGLLGPTTISGFVDAYYGYNYNHPASQFSGNGLQPFTQDANGFALNMVELIVDKPPDATSSESRVGYHVSAGYGQAAAAINGTDVANNTEGGSSNFFLKEAYISYLAPIGKGLTIQVGKFVTPAGAEVIESNANWNYTRSILFYTAIPYFHFGANAKYTFNPKWSLTGYLVDGWNNSAICHDCVGQSSGMTYGASLAYTPNAKWSAIENYIAGPQLDFVAADPTSVTDWRQLSDTVVSYTPNTKWAFTLNGDYGFGPKGYTCTASACSDAVSAALPVGIHQIGPTATWWGAAGYAKYTINPKSYFAARYEYYDDPQGYTLFGTFSNEDSIHVQEATGTYAYNLTSGLQIRGEYRYDFANQPLFERTATKYVKDQNTATLGFIYTFSSVNAK
jgi:hypothetical protein